MTTSERTNGATKVAYLLLAGGLPAVVASVLLLIWILRPPQMGADEEVFTTVDALFTAVTARDEKLLGECERRLHAYRDAGKLPRAASDYLDSVIRTSRAGGWTSAAETLYGFMRAQRRDGATEQHARKKPSEGPRRGARGDQRRR